MHEPVAAVPKVFNPIKFKSRIRIVKVWFRHAIIP